MNKIMTKPTRDQLNEGLIDDAHADSCQDLSEVAKTQIRVSQFSRLRNMNSCVLNVDAGILSKFNALASATEFKGKTFYCLRIHLPEDLAAQISDVLFNLAKEVIEVKKVERLRATAWPVKEASESMEFPVLVAKKFIPRTFKLINVDGEDIDRLSVTNASFGEGSIVNAAIRMIANTTSVEYGADPYVRFEILGVRLLKAVDGFDEVAFEV